METGGAQRRSRGVVAFAAAVLAATRSGASAATAAVKAPPSPLREAPTERAAITLLREDEDLAAKPDPADATWLVKQRCWWSAARELVTLANLRADREARVALESAVRRDVGALRLEADALLLALSPPRPDTAVAIRCALQWAQNSSAIFLSGKYAHRWSSPGALKVHDQRANVSECCFNFSASGEHSQLRKKYAVDLHFLHKVSTWGWSVQPASAGYFTVTILKEEPAKWSRLLKAKGKPSYLGVWDKMHSKWALEVERFKKEEDKAAGKLSAKQKDEMDREEHEDAARLCPDHRSSPFFRNPETTRLCEAYWPPKMEGNRGSRTLWLVLFFSPRMVECEHRSSECIKLRDSWTALQKKVPDISKAKVGVVNCDEQRNFCNERGVEQLPSIRRFRRLKEKVYYGKWDIDSVMKFVTAGMGKS